jgi:hypothetical protein
MARYCSLAVWHSDYQKFFNSVRIEGPRISTFAQLFRAWMGFHLVYNTVRVAEWTSDLRAKMVNLRAWLHGFRYGGFEVTHDEAAGLVSA